MLKGLFFDVGKVFLCRIRKIRKKKNPNNYFLILPGGLKRGVLQLPSRVLLSEKAVLTK